ncbi:MAG: hypothetical protein LBC21_02480 [Oscillospiraceae bacterium]|jgi:hypothetical protein|nr:hypothetical protein [Oscillospiraceae bacterium]
MAPAYILGALAIFILLVMISNTKLVIPSALQSIAGLSSVVKAIVSDRE